MEINSNTPSGPLAMVVVLLGGLVLGGYGVYAYTSQSAALDSTETVNATVTATSVDEIPSNNRRGDDDYRPQVSFNYTYEGDSYSSSNLYPSGVTQSAGSRGGAESMLEGYESGANVTAHVPTDSPGSAFLKSQRSTKPLLMMGFGALLAVLSAASIVRSHLAVIASIVGFE
jgi:hypothetical protein